MEEPDWDYLLENYKEMVEAKREEDEQQQEI